MAEFVFFLRFRFFFFWFAGVSVVEDVLSREGDRPLAFKSEGAIGPVPLSCVEGSVDERQRR